MLGNEITIYNPFKIYEIIYDENHEQIRERIEPDFYFIVSDKKFIIEYNGEQHYQPVFGNNEQAKEKFRQQQIQDKYLREVYCLRENINLIEIDGRIYTGEKIKTYIIEQFKELGISYNSNPSI